MRNLCLLFLLEQLLGFRTPFQKDGTKLEKLWAKDVIEITWYKQHQEEYSGVTDVFYVLSLLLTCNIRKTSPSSPLQYLQTQQTFLAKNRDPAIPLNHLDDQQDLLSVHKSLYERQGEGSVRQLFIFRCRPNLT